MTAHKPHLTFVDTTLREGLQSAILLFQPGASPHAYAKSAIENVDMAYMEVYGPEIYYAKEEYELLVVTLGPRLQLYCGVVDNFDPAKKTHIKDLPSPRLSLTVIHKNQATIDTLQSILDEYPSATMRLGIECAGSADRSALHDFLQQVAQLDRVENITLSDSNGIMAPEDIRELIASLPRPLNSTLGLHLHNDRGLSVANTLAAIDACSAVGIKEISFDYTYSGLGERYGLLSLQEIAALGQPLVKGDSGAGITELSQLFTEEALQYHRLPYMKKVVHTAASHFDVNGKLRPEYRTVTDNWSTNGQ